MKRTADQSIAHCSDISSVDELIGTLKRANLNVRIFEVSQSDIEQIELLIPDKLKPIANTMKLHQIVWDKRDVKSIELRELTCTECGMRNVCTHYTCKPSSWKFLEIGDTVVKIVPAGSAIKSMVKRGVKSVPSGSAVVLSGPSLSSMAGT